MLVTLFQFFFLTIQRPPTFTLFPYTTLFRSSKENPRGGTELHPWSFSAAGRRACRRAGPADFPSTSISIASGAQRSEEHTSELQSLAYLVCRLLLEKKNAIDILTSLYIILDS